MRPDRPDLSDPIRLPPELEAYLRETNPRWAAKPARVIPAYRRWAFHALLRKLETSVAPTVVLRGARQAGKTTTQRQVIEHLVHARPAMPWPEIADQLNQAVIRRVIEHDLRLARRGRRRDQQSLEEVFRLVCRDPGQAPGQASLLAQLPRVLAADVGRQRVRSCLRLL